jgi:hypothetical protein
MHISRCNDAVAATRHQVNRHSLQRITVSPTPFQQIFLTGPRLAHIMHQPLNSKKD